MKKLYIANGKVDTLEGLLGDILERYWQGEDIVLRRLQGYERDRLEHTLVLEPVRKGADHGVRK